jgi:cytochrome c oxidase subunit 2
MHLQRLWIAVVVTGIVATSGIVAQVAPAISGAVTEVQMTAKKFEFTPHTVRVHSGDHVKLVLTALDHTHGIKIKALNINQKVEKGETVTVEFTAPQPGNYPFECSNFCGLGHGKMKGELIVE